MNIICSLVQMGFSFIFSFQDCGLRFIMKFSSTWGTPSSQVLLSMWL
jgi:hypothetical protein